MMKKYLLLLTFTLTLFAQNPKSFSALGDVIYDDVDKFKNLKSLASMQDSQASIDAYIASAETAKQMGFAVDAKEKSVDGKSYLSVLRKLSIERDAIVLSSRDRFKEAMSDEDGLTINGMVGFGVINAENYKTELIRYYETFAEDQNLSNIEPLYLRHLATFKKDNNTSLSQEEVEARENEARILRMRAKSKAKEDALARSVEEQQKRDKKNVLNEQKKALGL